MSKKYVAMPDCVILERILPKQKSSRPNAPLEPDPNRNTVIGKVINGGIHSFPKDGDIVGCRITDAICVDIDKNIYCIETKDLKFKVEENEN